MANGKWLVVAGGLDEPSQVIPVDDLIEHLRSPACPCHPTVKENIVCHHAADGREHSEPDMYPEWQERPN